MWPLNCHSLDTNDIQGALLESRQFDAAALLRMEKNYHEPQSVKNNMIAFQDENQASERIPLTKWPRQVFSAIQPSGEAHLGNYLGAIQKWVQLQNSEENSVLYAIADLHSITTPKDPKELNENIFRMAATLLACGINSSKTVLFQQSAVSQHTNLSWILGTMVTIPQLSHLPQYKEKCNSMKSVPVGIFLYPVLQAADIMLYRSTHVPIGEDQVHHITLANFIVKSFNSRFGSVFPKIDSIIDSSTGRIKNLMNPEKKMSKSDFNPKTVISLTDEPQQILTKCKQAVTDSIGRVTYDPKNRPGVSNLILIHSGITGKTTEEIVKESENLNTGQYKLVLAEVIIDHLKPIREKINEYLNAREYLVSELNKGAEKANSIAEKTLKEVKERMGFDLDCGKSETALLENVIK